MLLKNWLCAATLLLTTGGLHAQDYSPAGEGRTGVSSKDPQRFLLPPRTGTEPTWTAPERSRGYVVYTDHYLRTFWKNQVPHRDQVAGEVSCVLARDEHEPIQIGVYNLAHDQTLKDVTVEVKCDLPCDVLRLNHRPQTPAAPQLKNLGATDTPFYFEHAGRFDAIEPETTGTFWLTFYAPPNAAAGEHKGTVTIRAGGGEAVKLELTVSVRPFLLPKPDIAYGMYWYPGALGAKGVSDPSPYMRDQVEHGMTMGTFYVFAETPHQLKVDDPPGSAARLISSEQARRELDHATAWGFARPGIPHLMLDYTLIPQGGWLNDPLTQEQKFQYADQMLRYSQRNSLPELAIYMRDEPPAIAPDSYTQWMTQWKRTNLRTAAAMSQEATVVFGHLHDIWITNTGLVTPEMMREAKRQGAAQWSYGYSHGSYNALTTRYEAGLYTWGLGLSGNMQWCYYTRVDPFVQMGGGQPSPHVAWEGRREGVDDYRYLRLVELLAEQTAGSDPQTAAKAQQWLDSWRQRIDWQFYHGIDSGDRSSGPFAYPAPQIELQEYDQLRQQASELAMAMGASERVLPAVRTKTIASQAAKWEAEPFASASIEQCIAGLSHTDFYVRRSAAAALAERGEEASSAVAALTTLLDDADTRIVALRALGSIGPQAGGAVSAMEPLVSHEDVYVAMSTVWWAGDIGEPALPVLRQGLRDPRPPVAQMAGRSLSQLGPAAAPAVPELVRLLTTSDSEIIRRGAIEALTAIGPQAAPATPALTKLVAVGDKNVYALLALAAIGPAARNAVPTIKSDYLKDRRYWDAVNAYTLYRITGDKQYILDLASLIESPPDFAPYVNRYASRMLDLLGVDAAEIAPRISIWLDANRAKLGAEEINHIENYLRAVEQHTNGSHVQP